MGKKIRAAAEKAALLLIACFALPAHAIDGVSIESGGGDNIRMWRVGVQSDWDSRWLESGNWHLGGYWDAQIGHWHGESSKVTDIGLTPVFRYQQTSLSQFSPYLEAAIGFHLVTPVDESHGFSTSFQFGDHIGIGARFGERGRYDASLRLQHLSNGGIKKPNEGVNFLQVRFQLHLD